MNKKRKKRGFTLVETLIYTGILAMLIIVVVSSLVAVVRVYRAFDVHRDIQDSALASFDRMTREIRNAGSVSTSGSVFGSNPGSLVVSVNEGGTPIVREFVLDDGVLHLYEDGTDQGPLTSSGVTVSNLVFYYSITDYSQLVKIEMQLQAGAGDVEQTKDFQISTILRGSYND